MIKPLADRIVVKPAEAEQKTSSGLFIPDNAKEKPMQGKVVAVGPGRKNDGIRRYRYSVVASQWSIVTSFS